MRSQESAARKAENLVSLETFTAARKKHALRSGWSSRNRLGPEGIFGWVLNVFHRPFTPFTRAAKATAERPGRGPGSLFRALRASTSPAGGR